MSVCDCLTSKLQAGLEVRVVMSQKGVLATHALAEALTGGYSHGELDCLCPFDVGEGCVWGIWGNVKP